jgi:hypothetical protein
LEFVKRSGATVLGHDECVQSVLDLRLAVKDSSFGIHVTEVIFKLFKKNPVRLSIVSSHPDEGKDRA